MPRVEPVRSYTPAHVISAIFWKKRYDFCLGLRPRSPRGKENPREERSAQESVACFLSWLDQLEAIILDLRLLQVSTHPGEGGLVNLSAGIALAEDLHR